ncbi:MAG: YfcC family protein [Anaerovoracaceae bacterium]|jgi:uncharacterized ion transporter superfamily protein YfcC
MPTLNDKKRFHFPSSILMLFIIIAIVCVLTCVIPAGQYSYTEHNGMKLIQGDSFRYVDRHPVNPFRLFVAIQEGFIDGAQIIFLILFGYFWVYCVMQTGAFQAMLNSILNGRLKNSRFFIPVIMLVFALAGSTYGEMETVYGLLPVFAALAIALGYDALVGMCMTGMAVAVGFASATTNPFTIGIAQSIGELPLFSGLGLRWIVFAAFVSISILFVMRYASRIKKDPSKSLLYGLDFSAFTIERTPDAKLTGKHKVIMLSMVVTVAVIVFGTLKLDWYINEMAAVFLISGIVVSLIGRAGPEEIVSRLLRSFSEMTTAMVVVGLSRAVLVIMKHGLIIDSVIHGMSSLMQGLPDWGCAEMMLIVQNILNFFIPSGSGQAAAIMPIMIPLADLSGLNRQIAVLAYQFGDGFSNLLWPTGPCAIMCGIAKIPLEKWYRFFLPIFGCMFALETFFIILATAIGYGPF